MNQNEDLAIDPRLFDVRELAAYFRCDPETVKRQARSGRLPGFKFGKSWYFRLQDIAGMIDTAIHATHPVQAWRRRKIAVCAIRMGHWSACPERVVLIFGRIAG